ncbi:MAG: hypothetical protein L3J52_08215 [Proteobacteria bacterium]|nr:hypothetical protein [Pseudomonadota bacterium]
MSLKIIGVGFGRTGTLSSKTALNELGFNCYHMDEVLFNKDNDQHLDFWLKVAKEPEGKQHNWHEVFENYSATVDNPGCCVWRELIAIYPDSKVLLTLHPKGPEGWYKSTMSTIYQPQIAWQSRVMALLSPRFRKVRKMTAQLIWQRSHKNTMKNKQSALAHYQAHIEEIKRTVSAENLLIFSVDQGWKPLCHFLGKAVPKSSFPKVNDSHDFKKRFGNFKKKTHALIFLIVIMISIVIYATVMLA